MFVNADDHMTNEEKVPLANGTFDEEESMKQLSMEQIRGSRSMKLYLKAFWDTQFKPSRPVLEGKLHMKWDQPFLNIYGQKTEIRICLGYQKVSNFEKRRDWIAFYGKVGDGEFTD